MKIFKNIKQHYVLLLSTGLCLIGLTYIGLNDKDEAHLLAKTSEVLSTEEDASLDSHEEEGSSESEGEEASVSGSADDASSSTELPSSESQDSSSSESEEEISESKSSEEDSSSEQSLIESSSKPVEQESSSEKESTNLSVEEDSSLKNEIENQASTEVVGTDENLSNLPEEELEDNYYFSVAKNQTTEEFIDAIKVDAQEIAWSNDLYASVMIAQAILETGSGNSTLSSPPNHNLFGVKGSYEGASVVMKTNEDDGNGNLFVIHSSFRKYPSYRESLEDYAILLREGIAGNPSFYQNTWKTNAKAYTDVTQFLTGRYATDTRYAQKLNAIIVTYQLTQYDVAPGEKQAAVKDKNNSYDALLFDGNEKIVSKKSEVKENFSDFETVSGTKKGDTFATAIEEAEEWGAMEDKVGLMQRKIQDVPSEASFAFKGH